MRLQHFFFRRDSWVSRQLKYLYIENDPTGPDKRYILFVDISGARSDPSRRARKNLKQWMNYKPTSTHEIPLLTRASYCLGLYQQLFFRFSHPVDIEISHTRPLDFSSARPGFEKIVKKVPRKLPITRRIGVQLQILFLHRDAWICAINWSTYASLLARQTSRNDTFCSWISPEPDPTPSEERGKIAEMYP